MLVLILPVGITLLAASFYAVYRKGFYALGGIVPVCAVVAYKTVFIHDAFVFLASSIVIGSCAGFMFGGKINLQRFLIAAALSCAFLSYGDYLLIGKVTHEDYLMQSKAQAIELLGSSSLSDAEKASFSEKMNEAIPIVKSIMPFYYFLSAFFWSSFVYMTIRLFMRRKIVSGGITIRGIELFRMNDYLIFALIGSIAALLAAGSRNKIVYAASLNTLLILATLYLVQALGVMKFFLAKKRLPSALLPATVIFILLLGIEATFFTAMLLAGCGALDLWADFRKLNTPVPPAKSGTD
jgi:hypothetical protein